MIFDYNLDLYSNGDVVRVRAMIQDIRIIQQVVPIERQTINGRPVQIMTDSPEFEVALYLLLKDTPEPVPNSVSKVIQIQKQIFIINPFIQSVEMSIGEMSVFTLDISLRYRQSFPTQLEAEVYLVTKELTE